MPELPAVRTDETLVAISRSDPGTEAQAVLDLCVRPQDTPAIVAMAKLSSARDVGKYVKTGGKEPELQDDTPVWLVQFKGEIRYRSISFLNPVCMVKNGEPTIYGPYGGRGRNGNIWFPPEDSIAPSLALPALTP